jgi:hypothetical protein
VKLEKLAEIYRGDSQAQIPDRTLYLLLRHRMVLQFNGALWYGVHPLAVDILRAVGSLKPDEPGGTNF